MNVPCTCQCCHTRYLAKATSSQIRFFSFSYLPKQFITFFLQRVLYPFLFLFCKKNCNLTTVIIYFFCKEQSVLKLIQIYPYILSVAAKNIIYGHVIKHVKLGCTLGLMHICTYYGNTGCPIFKRRVQNWKDFCLKFNKPK